MAEIKQTCDFVVRDTNASKRPAVYFPNGNYVLTPVFSSKESMELAKERLRKRHEERNFGFL
ncbi:hypothetical protein I7648_10685 [Collinsella tanakaei]|nr:hypothetical protein [Collinsella tanakaei]